jgi:hypothetical protein
MIVFRPSKPTLPSNLGKLWLGGASGRQFDSVRIEAFDNLVGRFRIGIFSARAASQPHTAI